MRSKLTIFTSLFALGCATALLARGDEPWLWLLVLATNCLTLTDQLTKPNAAAEEKRP